MKKLLILLSIILGTTSLYAQRVTDHLDRGLVVIPASTGGNLVSWRVFGEEYYDVTYNVYRDGAKIATGLKVSNYNDKSGSATNKYQVSAVVRGKEQTLCSAAQQWTNGMLTIPVQAITGRDGTDVTSHYALNDVSMGDLDGDGIVEFIVKRVCDVASDPTQSNCFHVLDCYDRNGNRLWWIDLGPNMLSGADEQWDAVCYDWDQDGKAEVLLRCQDNAIIHYADGTSETIGSSTVDTRWSGIEYTSSGNEYLLYLEGSTGKPYQIGPSTHPDYMDYPLTRGLDSDWGSGIVGHRSTKHYFGAPFLDGRHASIFLGRGCYTKHKMASFDVDPLTHALTQRWAWECSVSGSWFGQGYHNFAVGDVDWDGRDEIIFGSMVIDDNGKGLSTTGLGHGDAQHCSDFDPYRMYEEQFACNETSPANNYRNAVTSEIYYRQEASGDDGRALMANFTNDYPGAVGRSVGSGWVGACSGKIISELNGDSFISWGDLNQRIYWDGDLLDEYFDSPGTEGYGAIYKPASNSTSGGRWNFSDSKCNNWSKNNPGAIGDIFGDWREELVMRKSDNTALLVYSTGIPTTYRIPTLWSDHQYRNAMVWQSMGYNQPPHKSYYLGELENITTAPPTNTMTDRTEVANGGTITTTDEHLIVCETNDTKIAIEKDASPYMVTFNIPSWVQGTASSNSTAQKATINYTYYTCDVTGGPLTGDTRIVKQGDGILNLPKVDMTYTGNTDVWAGTVNFDGTAKQSALWLNRFAELNSDGGVFRSIKADYGSVIRPGGKENIGTLTAVDTLTMGFGSRIVFDLDGENVKSDQINCGTLIVESKTWKYGPKYLVPVIELAGNLAEGKYLLGNVAKVSGSLANIKIEGTGTLKSGLTLEDGCLYLTLGSVRGASNVTWAGAKSSTWDYAATENFYLTGDETKTPEIFVSGDIVNFNDSSSVRSITIKDEMTLDTMYVDNTGSYAFSGSGKIVAGAFVKEGTGTVTMSNDNTYTGGSFLRGGTTVVNSLSNSTQAYGSLGDVVASGSKLTIENGATLKASAFVQNGSPIMVKGTDGGIIYNDNTFTQQKVITGTLLTKSGSGYLGLSVDNTSLAKLVIKSGSVGSVATPAKAVEMQGGTLSLATGSSCSIDIPAGKTATINYTADRGTYSNALTGSGTVSVYYTVVNGSTWYATRTALNGNWSAFEGTVKPTALAADGRFCINNSYGLAKGTMNIASGIEVQSTAKTFAIGNVTGSGNLGGVCSLSSSSPGSYATWNVGNENNFTYAGNVVGSAIFNKVGTGTMTVSGKAWTNTGGVNIKAGTIKLMSTANLGTSALTIAKDASLTGIQVSTAGLTNTSVTVNGTVQPGLLLTSTSGNLFFNNNNVTINAGGTLRLGISAASTSATTMSGCAIKNINKLTINGTISLFFDANYVPKVGDELRLWTGVTTFAGSPTVVSEDLSIILDDSRISEGVVVVKAVDTGISNVTVDGSNAKVYDTTGKFLGTDLKSLPAGIYVVDGKKVVIK